MTDIQLKLYTKDELLKLLYDYNNYKWSIPVLYNDGNVPYFKGFHYFSPEDFNAYEDSKYLVAYIIENNKTSIIGVIKYSVYGSEYQYQGLSYIDIQESHKGKGVAKLLISELNKHLDNKMILKLSFLSKEGAICNLNKLFKKLIYGVKVYDSDETIIK